ncbi:transporter substrate-binding domain-containing protein [Pseudomonas sp. UBA4194]|jgi:polar amino acid transport system substrate-binding protein|uniref:transporter substrate-binding domain-containing protein n=1 Tax=Pseudomonas sp. UBA4194 TaxID=1947317 RepID=UPI0025DD047C|nr:transporter substrate-binding domain-containing protein [Pseudomonas sp. UBA4194]
MITRRHFSKLVGVGVVGASTGLMALGARAAASSSLERVKASGVLRIGGIGDGAPYYQKSLTGGPWRGFYVDICQKLADDLGIKLSILETTWGNSVLDLQAGKTDVFFGLNPTPERQKVIDFSGPVFKNAFTFIAKKSVTAKSWEDLDTPQTRISVDAGSSHDSAVTRLLPKASISRLKTASDATAALQSNRVDAQCLVMVLALALRAKHPSIGELIVPTPVNFTTSNAGFRREEDTSWRDYVDAWISEHRDNGFIKEAIMRNMALVGVTQKDFPEGFEI